MSAASYIKQGDPNALFALRARLERETASHDGMLANNRDWRARGRAGGKQPHPAYSLQKAAMRIDYLKKRIATLQHALDTAPVTVCVGGVEIRENPLAMRIQIRFPAKPSQNVHDALRTLGFRWSGLNMAWQRHLNDAGRAAAQRVAALLAANEAFKNKC